MIIMKIILAQICKYEVRQKGVEHRHGCKHRLHLLEIPSGLPRQDTDRISPTVRLLRCSD